MIAVILNPAGANLVGTLALVPLSGGAPRPILENVGAASWAPDGENLAAVISGGGGARLEYPIGKVVYRTAGFIFDMRASPDGEVIAVEETRPVTFQGGSGWIGLIDRSGKRTTVYDGWVRNCGVAWLPGGKEFVFAIPDSSGSYREVYAASRSGKKRLLGRFAGAMTLHDVSRDGRLLFAREDVRILTIGGIDGGKTEGIVSWLDESVAGDLSPDGNHVLLSEIGSGGGARGAVYFRPTSGGDAIRLGDGQGLALSPDGKWALATSNDRPELLLYPTGVGQRKTLPVSGYERFQSGRWLPDGKRIFFNANVRGRATRCFLLDLAGGAPRPVGPEGGLCAASSPDGEWLAVEGPDREMSLVPVDGAASPRPVRGWAKEWTALQWSADGRSLFITNETEVPMSIRKLDLETGRTELVRTLVPPDKAGVQPIAAPIVTRDGRTYAYTYIRLLGDLYVAKGVQ
jgi:Tol biopolymer transport system component